MDEGADVNAKDNKVKTPLFDAVRRGNLKVLRIFMSHKADVLSVGGDGQSVLFID